jgi:hypothetical protein
VSYIYRRHDGNISGDPRIVRREFARALAASARRRRSGAAQAIPANFFEQQALGDAADWF